MNKERREKLAKAGFVETTVTEFLGLTPEDEAWIEMKLALSNQLRERRRQQNLKQTELAAKLKSSQSRVAKMEAGKSDVSFDLLLKGLLNLGVTPHEIGNLLATIPYKQIAHLKSFPQSVAEAID